MTKSLSDWGFTPEEIAKVEKVKTRPGRLEHCEAKNNIVGQKRGAYRPRAEKICPACGDFVLARNNCIDCGYKGRGRKLDG